MCIKKKAHIYPKAKHDKKGKIEGIFLVREKSGIFDHPIFFFISYTFSIFLFYGFAH